MRNLRNFIDLKAVEEKVQKECKEQKKSTLQILFIVKSSKKKKRGILLTNFAQKKKVASTFPYFNKNSFD